ncbi:ketosteroid isomerase-related protein [Rubrimonas cliftonensis]|uniref:SnoaL-like domain-containing protein n=1 Tax=Rubrimonas cliftonensis TaxID=89524 RepID=A0A1H4A3Q3_9RHOB|nr:ketosteroid isomerase-related protein [Rubrimonas cliftonensis]SEA30586.1 conserved hypothetical protein, steroid delta-isomerase-related [Rubrimonas cliftonensis]
MTSEAAARDVVAAYYAAFNAGDSAAMLALVTDDVRHDVNQGAARIGRGKFAEFLAHMDRCYSERLADLVVMAAPGGVHAAARFTVHGSYKATDEGLPEAKGQTYVLDAGAFLEVRDGKVSRVATCYNLNDWIAQVSA